MRFRTSGHRLEPPIPSRSTCVKPSALTCAANALSYAIMIAVALAWIAVSGVPLPG